MPRQKLLTTLIAASCCLPLSAWAQSELASIVGSVLHNDPVMLEAKARVEEAEYVIKSTRAQHYPTLGLQTAQNLNTTENDDKGALALTGRLNLFSFGAIQSQVKRDKAKRDLLSFKTDETRENLAYTVSKLYLAALRAKELLRAEKKNYDRHQTIVDTLTIITKYDPGRRSELAQAQARQLQVRNRMYQYQRTMRVSLAQLKRYVPTGKPTLRTDFEPTWRSLTANRKVKEYASHPGLQAQRAEKQAVHYEMRSQKLSNLPRIDLEVQQAHAFNNRNRQDPVVRVVLNWDFLNLGSRYTAQSYAKQYAASAAREKLLQQELSSRGQMALVDIEETGKQVQSALKQIEASEKVVSMYQLQFKIGRRSLIELLNAHNELASMEITRVNAQNDRRMAMLEWLYAQAMLDFWVKQEQTAPAKPQPSQPTADTEQQAPTPKSNQAKDKQTTPQAPAAQASAKKAPATQQPVAQPATSAAPSSAQKITPKKAPDTAHKTTKQSKNNTATAQQTQPKTPPQTDIPTKQKGGDATAKPQTPTPPKKPSAADITKPKAAKKPLRMPAANAKAQSNSKPTPPAPKPKKPTPAPTATAQPLLKTSVVKAPSTAEIAAAASKRTAHTKTPPASTPVTPTTAAANPTPTKPNPAEQAANAPTPTPQQATDALQIRYIPVIVISK